MREAEVSDESPQSHIAPRTNPTIVFPSESPSLMRKISVKALSPKAAASGRLGIESVITEIIDRRLVEVEFQPVVDVVHNQVVGFEALSRGPKDSPTRRC